MAGYRLFGPWGTADTVNHDLIQPLPQPREVDIMNLRTVTTAVNIT